HGQHEHQDLMKKERHLPLLDSFGDQDLHQAFQSYIHGFDTYKKIELQVRKQSDHIKENAQRLDLLHFQISAIDDLQLQPSEDETLLSEKTQLGNYEKIFQSLKGAYETLYGEQKGLDWVGRSMGELESIADLDESYKKMFEDVSNSYFMLEEMTYTLRDTIEQL